VIAFYGYEWGKRRRLVSLSRARARMGPDPEPLALPWCGHPTPSEKAVRKLLVASQKTGVGKTTTSINLAAATARAGARVLLVDADPLSNISTALNLASHPGRQTLRQAGIDLPGVLFCGVLPGLDVISPYEEGGCSDADLDELFGLVASPTFEDCYGCLVVDSPPFMGANPAQLLATCEEYLLVMRAEPLAYRTLPAFLELVQRSQSGRETAIVMRGILLTLPEGEASGGRWERELRGRFSGRILSPVIPHDEEVSKELTAGRIVTSSRPESAVAERYQTLAETLGLASEGRAGKPLADAATPLLAAAASFQTAGAASRQTALVVGAPSTQGPTTTAELDEPPPFVPKEEPVTSIPDFPAHEEFADDPHEPEGLELPPPEPEASRPLPPVAPSAHTSLADFSVSEPEPEPEPVSAAAVPEQPAAVPPSRRKFDFKQAWFIWICLAVLAGLSLRVIELADTLKPVAVGVAVAALVILLIQVLTAFQEQNNRKKSSRSADSSASAETRKSATTRTGGASEAATRVINFARYRRGKPRRRDDPRK
jgi:chromosome partitioning protein